MSKIALIGTGGVLAVAATAYYVSPAAQADLDVPPVLVTGTPEEVRRQLDGLAYKALAKAGADERELLGMSKLTPRWEDATHGHTNVMFLGDHVVRIDFALAASGSDRTELDVKVTLPDSAFSRSPELHPYDLKAAAATIDLLATEYIGSVLDRRRMASSRELLPLFQGRTGFTEDEARAFSRRIEAAAKATYGERIKSYAASLGGDGWGSDWYAGPSDADVERLKDEREVRQAERAAQREADEASAPMESGNSGSEW